MGTKTERELVNRVLSDLSVSSAGNEAEVEDFDDIQQRVETIVAELNVRKVAYVPDTDQIPDELFESLVEYIIAKAGPGYGRAVVGQLDLQVIEDRMREICRAQAPRRTLSTDPILRRGAFVSPVNLRNGN